MKGAMLGKALQKTATLSRSRIEVLIARKRHDRERAGMIQTLLENQLLAADQILIYANPNTKKAALWIGPQASISLPEEELTQWLEDLESDLHQTHPDRALTLAVMSLAIALNSIEAQAGESHQR